jgi:hypothetical protein
MDSEKESNYLKIKVKFFTEKSTLNKPSLNILSDYAVLISVSHSKLILTTPTQP